MIRIRLGGSALTQTLSQSVQMSPLTGVVAAAEFLVGTPQPTKIMDLTAASSSQSNVEIYNRASFEIFLSYSTATLGTPPLTTANGIPMPANSYITLDNVGGLSIWAIAGTPQTAGSGTRTNAGYVV